MDVVGDRQPQTPAEAPAHARGPPGTERPAWHLPWAPSTGRLRDGHAGPAEEPGVAGGLATRRPQLRHPAPPWAPAVGPPPPASWGWPALPQRLAPPAPHLGGGGGTGAALPLAGHAAAGRGLRQPRAGGAGLVLRRGGWAAAEGCRRVSGGRLPFPCMFAEEAGARKGPHEAASKHTAGQRGRLPPGPAAPSRPSPGLAAGLGRLPRLLVGVVQAGLPPGAVLDGGPVQACRLSSSRLQPLEALGRERRGLWGCFWPRGSLCRGGEA